jgi:hypothetical protein
VKPANILFTSDGEPLLTDFGVARTLGLVTSDQVSGTAEYLAPEVLDGAPPDPRADVYALAVVCYQALTSRPPYTGPVPLAVARAADAGVHDLLDDDPAVPGALARVVEQAMARDPARRFATADEFARALRTTVPAGEVRVPGPARVAGAPADDVTSGPTTTFGPRPPRPEPARERRSRRVPALVGVLALAAGGILLLRGPFASDDDGDCRSGTEPSPGAGALVVRGDVDGAGCTVTGVYQQQATSQGTTVMVLTIPIGGVDKRIGLGEPGDQVVLGDWDCDGVDTPALYRRSAGVVQYFDVWPEVTQQTYEPTASEDVPAGGTAELDEGAGDDGGDDCDRVRVAATQSEGSSADGDTLQAMPGAARTAAPVASAIMGPLVVPRPRERAGGRAGHAERPTTEVTLR